MVCERHTLEKLSMRDHVLLACVRLVMGVPMVNALKTTFSMPSIDGASGTIPGVPTPVWKPCEARLGPTPPEGWPTLLELRMKLKRSSFTIVGLIVLVSLRLINCDRPRLRAAKPGTLAPPCSR